MIKFDKKNLLISSLLSTSLLTLSGTALAQSSEEAVDEIFVTGSRIARKDLTGPSPVSIYDEELIQRSGVTSIGKLLREIPSVAGGAQTTSVNNGGSGAENISMRGLGTGRTLVLLNGRRAPDSSGGLGTSVDLNTIPVAMVKRVEVLKDGASAIYGSDAIAGVVNIILNDDFDGIATNVQIGQSDAGDGEKQQYDLTMGKNFDGGNFVFNATRVVESETVAGNRDWAKQAKFLLGGSWVDGGSSAPPWGRYDGLTLGPDYTGDGAGGLRAYDGSTDSYNFAPINYQRQPNERWILSANGNSDIDAFSGGEFFEETSLFGELQYTDRESARALAEQPLAPLAFYGFAAPYSADNAYNPTGVDINDWRRRVVEAGPRTGKVESQTIRAVVGLEGSVKGGYDWEAYYNYAQSDTTDSYGPIYDLNKVALAVGPTALNAEGVISCDTDGDGAITTDDDAACVPLNVFGENSITDEMTAYLTFNQLEVTKSTQETYAFNVTNSEIYTLPAGPVGIAAGFSYREETGQFTPDALVTQLAETGAVTGTPSSSTDGGFDVTEFYAEALIPLLADQPMAKNLDLSLGIRTSDYSTFGSTTNWKAGLEYRPNDELLLRGSAATGFRAPTIGNLFGGSGIAFPSVNDPCAANPTASCISDGVPTTGFTSISNQVRTLVGGNPDLTPEESESLTFGAVWQPSMLPGTAFSIDYYSVNVDNAISAVGAGLILSKCAEDGTFCDQITRFGTSTTAGLEGNPQLIDNRTTNVGSVETSGIDFMASWDGIETPFGDVDLGWEASYVDKYDKTQADGSVTEHAGFFIDDQDGHFANWRWTASVDWEKGPFALSADYRYIDGVTEFGQDLFGSCIDATGAEVTAGGNLGLTCVSSTNEYFDSNPGDFVREIESASYVDVTGSYDFAVKGIESRAYFGVDNLFNERPPISVDGFNDQTDVRTYDTIGRYFYTGVRFSFQ